MPFRYQTDMHNDYFERSEEWVRRKLSCGYSDVHCEYSTDPDSAIRYMKENPGMPDITGEDWFLWWDEE